MLIQDKVTKALQVIEQVVDQYKKPCLLCSFGKDSVLLLWLIRKHTGFTFPIVFFKQPFFPRKYAYADRLIADWNLDVFTDVPPMGTSMTKGNGLLEVVNHYPFGGDKNLMMPVGWIDHEKHPAKWLCGRDDVMNRPLGQYQWLWDCALTGHKGEDKDAVQGDVHLRVDIHQIPGGCHTAYPLRLFSDADVWECFERWNIPIHEERYEKVDGTWRTKPEKHYDPDYFPYCTRCLDKDGPIAVVCPKTGLEITNIGGQLQYYQHKELLTYMGDSKNS